jgi:hypothetical protein
MGFQINTQKFRPVKLSRVANEVPLVDAVAMKLPKLIFELMLTMAGHGQL